MPGEPVVIGDWIRESILGEGGFGIVTVWKNSRNEDAVTVKKCKWGLEANLSPRQRERWINEVDVLQKLSHPNLIQYRALPQILSTELLKHNPSRLPLLSMEYCSKGDLRKMLLNPENCCGLLEMDVRYILGDLISGVSFLHSNGITHRDIKPENIVLQITDNRPNNILYKIIDLGYAKEINSKNTCASFVGTMHYLAPEIFFGSSYSCSVDYWSLGVVAFEIICGIRPVPFNMSPAQWLLGIDKKTSEQICMYESLDGKITYSSEMYSESHVSGYFKTEMEKWLRLALDFDPQRRGYKQTNVDKATPDIFVEMENLLKRKCVTIFSAYTYEFRSYEIDDSTLFSTLQVWFERDTKVTIEDQIWLTRNFRCIQAGEEVFAVQCFDNTYPNAMMYVFKKQEIMQQKEFAPRLPRLAKLIFESDLAKPQVPQLKVCYAHILYFVYQQNNKYNTLLVAWRAMILYLCCNSKETAMKCKKMQDEINTAVVLERFSNECLELDCSSNEDSNGTKTWIKNHNDVKGLILPIANAVAQIVKRYESNNRRIVKLQNVFQEEYSPSVGHDLNIIFERTLDCYKESTKKANNKIVSGPCRELRSHFVDCLKCCENMLTSIDLHTNLRHVLDINLEQQKIMKIIDTCLLEIAKIKEKLMKNHLQRQSSIWNIVSQNKNINVPEKINEETVTSKKETVKADEAVMDDLSKDFASAQIYENVPRDNNCIAGNLQQNSKRNSVPKEVSRVSESTLYFSLPAVCSTNKLFHFPATDLVDENVTLRYQVQEKTNESFLQVKSILNENLNFDFLNCDV